MSKQALIPLKLVIATVFLSGMYLPAIAEQDSQVTVLKSISYPTLQLAQKSDNEILTVYGRTNCTVTNNLINELKVRKIPYQFKNVNVQEVVEELFQLEFEEGVSNKVSHSRMPLVYVKGKLLAAPNGIKIQQVLAQRSIPQKLTVNPSQNVVIIYSKSQDKNTQRLIKGLQRRQISYQLKDLDTAAIEQEFWKLLGQNGITAKSVDLPIVYVSDKVMIKPSMEQVLTQQSKSNN
ncbi:hypothetical protein PN478_08890 [Dolichospermum circinale CS-534/05]|uniref:hypothetical protein n=2 Tax=Aphanizomenonaceae TaxID=1892259 RepID=UPI002330EF3E|nr:hypothetical protein [Dolichospermum circinale]MDB9490636.1 hypothetical protein [Dolichospermum circinale CS-534/05]